MASANTCQRSASLVGVQRRVKVGRYFGAGRLIEGFVGRFELALTPHPGYGVLVEVVVGEFLLVLVRLLLGVVVADVQHAGFVKR